MKPFGIIGLALGVVFTLSSLYSDDPVKKSYHSPQELEALQKAIHAVPIDSGEYFLTSAHCKGCHGYDPQGLANVNANGEDINLYNDWAGSMMALSGKDPMWRAKVRHEMLVNPGHANELQTLCTSCHAPMGHYTAMFKGHQHYTLNDLYADSLGSDGVSCVGCHSIGSLNLGAQFSGQIPYDTNRVLYGPFVNPMVGPMQLYVGMIPAYSEHVSEGRMCSSCHTLITQTTDLNGNATGNHFVEQATFHEWKNSFYPDDGITCQHCHMPQVTTPVRIAVGYTALQGRAPFNKHTFAGANAFMVNLIKENKNALGISTEDVDFDSSLANINNTLRNHTVKLTVSADSIADDSLFLQVMVENLAGHKFPSGYPSRRAILQFVVLGNNGDTLFASGICDTSGNVKHVDPNWQDHQQMINSPQQSQVYELVMADVSGNRTTVLERASTALKDNRIPPAGFSMTHASYDTTKIAGSALNDPDFNFGPGGEGSGKDIVHYHVPLAGYNGLVKVHVRMLYQTVAPYWFADMFTRQAPEIDNWKSMYLGSDDKQAHVIKGDTIEEINITTFRKNINTDDDIRVLQNPVSDGWLKYHSTIPVDRLEIFNGAGRLMQSIVPWKKTGYNSIRLQGHSSMYILMFSSGTKKWLRKVLVIE
jgi:hypothetical protein